MTVKELIKKLQAADPERVVILPQPRDTFKPVGEVYCDFTFWVEPSGWGYAGDDPDDDTPGGVPAVCLWPVSQ
jgi:hypothetical protein